MLLCHNNNTVFHSQSTWMCCNSSSDVMFEVDSPWPRRNPHKDNSTITERSIYPNATRQSLLKSLRGETHRESRAEADCQGFNERVSAARSGGRTDWALADAQSRTRASFVITYIYISGFIRIIHKSRSSKSSL